jgi:hypothetical protein
MAHPYKSEAKAGHDSKVKAYAGGNSPTAKSAKKKTEDGWDGQPGLNTNEQAGLDIILTKPSLSKEVNPRIMRKAGGSVKGAMSLKRLDKPSRSKKAGGGPEMPSPEEAMRSAERLKEVKSSRLGSGISDADKQALRNYAEKEANKITPEEYRKGNVGKDEYALKKGGKVSHMKWEHSKADLNQDKKLAKKHGMSMEKWEKSALDKKHDEQQSTEGLKKGGRTKRADGGMLGKGSLGGDLSTSKKAKSGGVTININDSRSPNAPMLGNQPLGGPPKPPMGGLPPMPPGGGMPPMPPAPPPAPPMGGGMPMMAGQPMGGPMMPPPGGMPPMGGGMPPRPFKRGGKVRSTQDLTAGAGSGEGRLQKEELAAYKAGRKGFI